MEKSKLRVISDKFKDLSVFNHSTYSIQQLLYYTLNKVKDTVSLTHDFTEEVSSKIDEMTEYVNNQLNDESINSLVKNNVEGLVDDGTIGEIVGDNFLEGVNQRIDETNAQLSHIEKIITYITPQQFGAVGDGVNDDTFSLKRCFEYANNNFINIHFPPYGVYLTSETITYNGGYSINGCSSTIKSTGNTDVLFLIDKPLSNASKMGLIENLNLDGNGNVESSLHVYQGKSIIVRNVNTIGATKQSACFGNLESKNLWELTVKDCTFNANYGNGLQAEYAFKMLGAMSDNLFDNIISVNGSVNWGFIKTSASYLNNLHGYSYPEDRACDIGFYVYSANTKLTNITCDTPKRVGIQLDGGYGSLSNCDIDKYTYDGECIGVLVSSNACTVNNIYTSGEKVTMVYVDTLNNPSIVDFKSYSLTSPNKAKRDLFFSGKIPYRFSYDKSVNVEEEFKLNQFLFYNQHFYPGTLTKNISFKHELSTALYTVDLYEITGKEVPKYKITNVTTTGFTIVFTEEFLETLNIKIKVCYD